MDLLELKKLLSKPDFIHSYTEEEKLKIRKIAHPEYGLEHILLVLEEMSELIQASIMHRINPTDDLNIKEELVDCKIMMDNLFMICDGIPENRAIPNQYSTHIVTMEKEDKVKFLLSSIYGLCQEQKIIYKHIRNKTDKSELLSVVTRIDQLLMNLQIFYQFDSEELKLIENIKYERLDEDIQNGTLH